VLLLADRLLDSVLPLPEIVPLLVSVPV